MFDFNGIVGLVILALDIWAIVTIVQGRGPTERKILWIVLILVLPVIGLLLWLILARRARL